MLFDLSAERLKKITCWQFCSVSVKSLCGCRGPGCHPPKKIPSKDASDINRWGCSYISVCVCVCYAIYVYFDIYIYTPACRHKCIPPAASATVPPLSVKASVSVTITPSSRPIFSGSAGRPSTLNRAPVRPSPPSCLLN